MTFSSFINQEIQQKLTSINLEVCNLTLTGSIQFRWIQFANFKVRSTGLRDMLALDDINIVLVSPRKSYCLLSDSFNNITRR